MSRSRQPGGRPGPAGPPPHSDALVAPRLGDQLEGRNVVAASLAVSARVKVVWVDRRAKPSPKLEALERASRERGAKWQLVNRADLDRVARTGVHNGVIGFAEPLPGTTLKVVLDEADAEARDVFVVLLDEVQYEQNLGAIVRTAATAGVDAIVTPTRRGAALSPVVQRVAMGGAEEVPIVREGLNSALAQLKRRGIPIVGAEADGDRPYWSADLTGSLALILGGEDHGLGVKVRSRCDTVVSIPVGNSAVVTSLNVSVAAGLLLYERLRQQAIRSD